ncbi:MAG: hypothetical protein JXR86_16895 [Spirochaetales bacterium]|nr:hypothetical protein [Spirochaetales bacterium]
MSKIINRFLVLLLLAALYILFFGPEKPVPPESSQSEIASDSDSLIPLLNEPDGISLAGIGIHFPDALSPERVEEDVPRPVLIEPAGPVFTNEIKFVSPVVRDGHRSWFFKSALSGRIYELSPLKEAPPWSWVSEEEEYYLLKKNDTVLKVRKQ